MAATPPALQRYYELSDQYGDHYAIFLSAVLGMDLWDGQIEICDAVHQPGADVAVAGCHACSKTYTLAGICLGHLCMYPDGGIITTAPTFGQVKRIMWAEIRKAVQRTGMVFPTFNQTEIKTGISDDNFLIGIATNDATRFQGFHGNLLIVIDEAPGVFPELHEAIEGIRAGGDARKAQLGNPTKIGGPFWEAFTEQSASVRGLTISCMDTPNFEGVDLDELLDMDPDGNPDHEAYLDDNPIPYLITRKFVWRLADKYGRDSAVFKSRALAQFPDQVGDAVFPLAHLQRAKRASVIDMGELLVAGIDVAGGGRDATVVTVRKGANILGQKSYPDEDAVGPVAAYLLGWGPRDAYAALNIDSTGIGHYFVQHFKRDRWRVNAINFGSNASPVGNPQDARNYQDRKAQIYWIAREKLRAGQLRNLEAAPDAYRQMTLLKYFTHPGTNKTAILSKDQTKKLVKGSPDEAESVILAFVDPPGGTFKGIERADAAQLRKVAQQVQRGGELTPGRRAMFGSGVKRR